MFQCITQKKSVSSGKGYIPVVSRLTTHLLLLYPSFSLSLLSLPLLYKVSLSMDTRTRVLFIHMLTFSFLFTLSLSISLVLLWVINVFRHFHPSHVLYYLIVSPRSFACETVIPMWCPEIVRDSANKRGVQREFLTYNSFCLKQMDLQYIDFFQCTQMYSSTLCNNAYCLPFVTMQ